MYQTKENTHKPPSNALQPAQRATEGITDYHVIAIILWLLGCYTTWLFLTALGMPRWAAYLLTPIGQWMLTRLQAPLWHRGFNVVSLVFLFVDMLINAGGLFTVIRRLHNTEVWRMLEATSIVGPSVSVAVAFLLSIILGTALAAAPEIVWGWSHGRPDHRR